MSTTVANNQARKYRVAVIGSRNYNDKEAIYKYLDWGMQKWP